MVGCQIAMAEHGSFGKTGAIILLDMAAFPFYTVSESLRGADLDFGFYLNRNVKWQLSHTNC